MWKNKTSPLSFTTHKKINLNLIEDLNVRPEPMKF